MSWAIGYDYTWHRDIGYGVPALCDHPGCEARIDRGLSFVCGSEPYGGDRGCGLYFCSVHQYGGKQLCERCLKRRAPFTATPDLEEWVRHKATHLSWAKWREENGVPQPHHIWCNYSRGPSNDCQQCKQLRERYPEWKFDSAEEMCATYFPNAIVRR